MEEERRALESFLEKYSEEIAECGRTLFERLRARVPGARILVYDNYNALVIGFAATDRASSVVFSIALYPAWINLFFMRGAELADPHRMLKGNGVTVRHIPKVTAASLDEPRIRALIDEALAIADPPIDAKRPGVLIIRSICAKQRPRRRN